MDARTVVVVRTGVANVASITAALARLGVATVVTARPDEVERASMVVLPGVGAFGAGMSALCGAGLAEVLRGRVVAGRATLAVCLGMQLLCESSHESPGTAGLGVIHGSIERFGDGVRVPQVGWNRVHAGPGCTAVESGWAYFANSYRMRSAPDGWEAAMSEYGGGFVAALERGPVVACQFHPELSGPWGLALMRRWMERARIGEGVSSC